MSREYTKHYVVAMDETMIQRCIFCGETINDYSNAMWPNNQPPPQGFPEGEVYMSKGQPTILTRIPPQSEEIKDCKEL